MPADISEVSIDETGYPSLLREISGAPQHLFFKGNPKAWEQPLVSIVGTRKATEEGRTLAKRLAQDFVRAGVGVVSGLALGIDGAAHEGALLGRGITIAVLGNGLSHIYPRTHESLAMKILRENGTILSEYPPETPAFSHQFIERNRIISGLSLATIVVEAPERSGSLATARCALEQGREVFVFPGPSDHPNYRGSHWLIREGARLAASFADIKEDLSSLFADTFHPETSPDPEIRPHREGDEQSVLNAILRLGGSAKTEDIIASSGINPEAALAALAFLVIEGEVEETNGGFCIKR